MSGNLRRPESAGLVKVGTWFFSSEIMNGFECKNMQVYRVYGYSSEM